MVLAWLVQAESSQHDARSIHPAHSQQSRRLVSALKGCVIAVQDRLLKTTAHGVGFMAVRVETQRLELLYFAATNTMDPFTSALWTSMQPQLL